MSEKKRSPNGELKPYKINDGRYGIAASLGKDETGKRLRHVETGRYEQEVIDKMKLWLSKNGYMVDDTPVVINGQSTFDELVDEFKLKSLLGTVADPTYENYSCHLQYPRDYFLGKKLASRIKASLRAITPVGMPFLFLRIGVLAAEGLRI